MDERIEKARGIYERAVFAGDRRGVDDAVRGLDAVDADVALARGRLLHARFLEAGDGVADPNELSLFERAAALYQRLGDTRSEGEALFWIGCFHQVVRRDNAAAVPVLHRSSELVRQAGDLLTCPTSYVTSASPNTPLTISRPPDSIWSSRQPFAATLRSCPVLPPT
jgi:hypothetical protein